MPRYTDRKGPISKEESDKFAQGLNGSSDNGSEPARFPSLFHLIGMEDSPEPKKESPQQPKPMNLDEDEVNKFKKGFGR